MRYDKKHATETPNNNKFLLNSNRHGEGAENYYTLSFDYRFQHVDDEVWFAHAVPYTYTDMQNSIKQMMVGTGDIMRAEILCNSLSGMPVPLLTITENVDSYLRHEDQLML